MRARSIAAAVAMAASVGVFSQLTTSADAPTAVVISAHPCSFAPVEVGVWEASGAINDSGTFVRTEAASSPPDRPPFTTGPFRETFVFTGSQGIFTISAEERLTETAVIGVWQIRPEGTGGYADASGQTLPSLSAPLPTPARRPSTTSRSLS